MKQPLQKLIASRYGGRNIPAALVLPDGGRVALSKTPEINIYARTWNGLRALASPELGRLARAYVHNDIDFTGEARRVLGIAEALVGTVVHGRDHATARLKHWWHAARGNRANIQHHYDVSNAFYRMWLDERMVYSCAYFKTGDESIDEAQEQKLDHICRKLRLSPGERFLDIGCGWGALVMHAGERYGVQATGITLSENQHALANERIRAAGLQDRCQVLLQDYRDLPGEAVFDKIASVGMFEHVGLKNLPTYFGAIHRWLAPGGIAMNHGLTSIDPESRSVGLGAGEFIEKYVFPHGELPHLSLVVKEMGAAGLEVMDIETLRLHYAKTLSHWSQRLEANLDAARAHSGDKRLRIWRVYLAGCAHAFERNWVTIQQVLAVKPGDPARNPLPWTRDYVYR